MNGHERDTWNRLLDRHLLRLTVVVLVGLFVFLLFADRMVVNVPAGYRGVLWDRFGGRTYVYGEGLRLILPWNVLTRYEVRWQNISRRYHAIDATGMSIQIEMSTLIQANIGDERGRCDYGRDIPELRDEPCLGRLHKAFGPDYIERLVAPQIGSHLRAVVADKEAVGIYGPRRPDAEREIFARLAREIQRYEFDLIRVATVFMREVVLPPAVSAAIDEKNVLQHLVERESTEAARKKIEADGIRIFTETVAGSLTSEYLRLKGIEATLKIAESPNAKVVIIGSGPQGLPVVLGNDTTSPAPRPAGAPQASAPTPPATPPGETRPVGDAKVAGDGKPPGDGKLAGDGKVAGGKAAPAAGTAESPAPSVLRSFLNTITGRGQ